MSHLLTETRKLECSCCRWCHVCCPIIRDWHFGFETSRFRNFCQILEGLGFGFGKFGFGKKVLVSEKFGLRKKFWFRKIWYRKKNSPYRFRSKFWYRHSVLWTRRCQQEEGQVQLHWRGRRYQRRCFLWSDHKCVGWNWSQGVSAAGFKL